MLATSAIQKGKLLEDWVVDKLRQSGLDIHAIRNPGSGSGHRKGDINNAINISFECKNQKNFSPQWIEQAKAQQIGEEAWCLVWHPPREPLDGSVAIIPWYHYEALLLRSRAPKTPDSSRGLRYALESLKRAIKAVLRELGE